MHHNLSSQHLNGSVQFASWQFYHNPQQQQASHANIALVMLTEEPQHKGSTAMRTVLR